MDKIDIGLAFKVVVAAAVAFWAGLEPLVQLLIILMALDICTGMLSAFQAKVLSSSRSFAGLTKKMAIILIVMAAYALEIYSGLGLPIAQAVAAFYCANEGLSIIENVGEVGLPIPEVLRDAILKLRGKTTN